MPPAVCPLGTQLEYIVIFFFFLSSGTPFLHPPLHGSQGPPLCIPEVIYASLSSTPVHAALYSLLVCNPSSPRPHNWGAEAILTVVTALSPEPSSSPDT